VFESLHEASIIKQGDDKSYRSTIRVSNFYLPNLPNRDPNAAPLYYVHSSFPASSDSVFFGPDTYLFVSFLQTIARHLPQAPRSIIDVCCGSGAGAIHMARTYPQAKTLGLDLNPRALSLGGVNAQLAGVKVGFSESNLYAAVPDDMKPYGVDLIVSNPPYIASSTDGKDLPIYADGGAGFGLDISIRIVEEGMEILSSNGAIVVYTGVAIPTSNPGQDAFLEKLKKVEDAEVVEYTILHPDMWPEEIGKGAYADVCRIQVVGAVLRRNAKSIEEVKTASRRQWAI
jgi:methylase of polypeptide subunit release factors